MYFIYYVKSFLKKVIDFDFIFILIYFIIFYKKFLLVKKWKNTIIDLLLSL
jgi:hypothetical protein